MADAPTTQEPHTDFSQWSSNFFTYGKNGKLLCEGVPATELAAKYGTPLYVYSANAFRTQFREIADGFSELKPLVCYALKSNSTLAILDLLRKEGAGFDCVSMGEIMRCLKVGADPQTLVFAGVGKTREEIAYALKANILMFNVESLAELELIASVAESLKMDASVALRLNPDVDPRTHKFISTGQKESKFGIDLKRAEEALATIAARPRLKLRGIHLHIGSQITSDSRHAEAVAKAVPFLKEIQSRGFRPEFFNVGGGFGISYRGKEGLPLRDFAKQIVPILKQTGMRMLTEPGRYISGNSGILLTRVLYTKKGAVKPYAIVDAAMTDLIRPSIYSAYHGIWSAEHAPRTLKEGEARLWDVVGPVCESTDFLATNRQLPEPKAGELLSVFSAGAYGFCMSSNYNTRTRPAEILVDGTTVRVIRERETYDDLFRHELVGIK